MTFCKSVRICMSRNISRELTLSLTIIPGLFWCWLRLAGPRTSQALFVAARLLIAHLQIKRYLFIFKITRPELWISRHSVLTFQIWLNRPGGENIVLFYLYIHRIIAWKEKCHPVEYDFSYTWWRSFLKKYPAHVWGWGVPLFES